MFELTLLCPQPCLQALSDALEALDAASVFIEDANAHSADEQPLFGEPGMAEAAPSWPHTRVSALFATENAATHARAVLQAQDFFVACQVLDVQRLPEQDWVRSTQAQFAPVEIAPDFWVVPSWHTVPEQARISIRLDPGLAFGTGTHPTTRMCLRWLARQGRAHGLGRVLDYGCGSGILAIAAAKLGAQAVDAVDIDPAAVQATQANAQANATALHAGLPDSASGVYDTVLANILAAPLKVLAPLLCAHLLQSGSHLLLAGLLQRQAAEICASYAPYLAAGVALHVADCEDGWVLLCSGPNPKKKPKKSRAC